MRFLDRNTARYWLVLAIVAGAVWWSAPASFATGALRFVLLWLAVSAILDLLYYTGVFAFYDPELTVARGYNLSAQVNDTLHSAGLDYGFNFYDGDFEKSRSRAQLDKFEYAVRALGITPGARVMDVGCGCGDWLHYLQSVHSCRVTGINLSSVQVEQCRARGLDVIGRNWKDVFADRSAMSALRGQFDAITFWDTVEHYVPASARGDFAAQDAIYRSMFAFAEELLDPASPQRRVWTSCLHMRVDMTGLPWSWLKVRKLAYIYLLDKFHSGFYPASNGDRDALADNARALRFTLEHRRDLTRDYYMTSVLEPTHFGRHRFRLTARRAGILLTLPLVDPFWWQRMFWFLSEAWMLQFDPRDIDRSDVILWWLQWRAPEAVGPVTPMRPVQYFETVEVTRHG
jgi:cyclopropane fatty-acyl-phospholipid synthase-like methyltransferase